MTCLICIHKFSRYKTLKTKSFTFLRVSNLSRIRETTNKKIIKWSALSLISWGVGQSLIWLDTLYSLEIHYSSVCRISVSKSSHTGCWVTQGQAKHLILCIYTCIVIDRKTNLNDKILIFKNCLFKCDVSITLRNISCWGSTSGKGLFTLPWGTRYSVHINYKINYLSY